ncbi:hypothetical protein HY212_04125 [Candidatus Pacearchaeota archaeon]|nr:hypothetical protein [Candidatus Pacearchaeota archaeon]
MENNTETNSPEFEREMKIYNYKWHDRRMWAHAINNVVILGLSMLASYPLCHEVVRSSLNQITNQSRQEQLERITMDARDAHQWALVAPEIPGSRERDLNYQEIGRLSKYLF